MVRALGVILLLPMFAVAAPVPKERPDEKLIRQFGTPVDPDKDCAFTLDGTKLKMTVPGGSHNFAPGRGLANAPRVTRSVEGDFVAVVRITMTPGPTAEGGTGPLIAQAGMFVGTDEQNFAYHARSLEVDNAMGLRRKGRHGAWISGRTNGGGSSVGGHFDPESIYFRITRAGNKLLFAAAPDAKGWHEFQQPVAQLPERVTFGLFLTNSAKQSFTVEFDELTITQFPGGK